MPSEKKIMSVLGPTAVLSGIVYNQNLSFKQRERGSKRRERGRGVREREGAVCLGLLFVDIILLI